ncbi:Outer membrane protein assembly factor BamB [Paenibacillus sp. CECT 9249]|uniref:outer membrane protein assembly factor BamB family protein n=1 Tax=Paenibacillus sp. CECT 9249 TaxID=2845385 RepID=UPI001E426BAF|nr:PQQ-binding-like beta-propeller repeat protein [Paenibacillus sp. CECT 9249]CAH0120381.1 Outer membrane protein assembly factor BamB [Paenibacillus sp. CECT 9249]
MKTRWVKSIYFAAVLALAAGCAAAKDGGDSSRKPFEAGGPTSANLVEVSTEQLKEKGSLAPKGDRSSGLPDTRQIQIGMSKEQLVRVLESPDYEFQKSRYEGGELITREYWRYDVADSSYQFTPLADRNGYTVDVDFDGLRSGAVREQLIVEWDHDKVSQYIAYALKDGRVVSSYSGTADIPPGDSAANRLAERYGIEIGQTYRLPSGTDAAYALPRAAEREALFYPKPEQTFLVTALTEHYALIDFESDFGWIPIWYLTPETEEMSGMLPQDFAMKATTSLALYPNDSVERGVAEIGQRVQAIARYKDWLKVYLYQEQAENERAPRAGWIRERDVEPVKSDARSLSFTKAAVNANIRPGDAASKFKQIFGEPSFRESSEAVNMTGEPLQTLDVWRYETDAWQMAVTWSKDKTVRGIEFAYPEGETGYLSVVEMDGESGRLSHILRKEPFVRSVRKEEAWKFQSELAYNFLVGKAGSTLLVLADDGGYSGMHYDKKLYGVDAATGGKRWTIDVKNEELAYFISEDRRNVAVYTAYGDSPSLRYISANTGKTVWSKRFNRNSKEYENYRLEFSKANGVIVMQKSDWEGKRSGKLTAFDESTGKSLWTKTLADSESLILDRQSRDNVLIASKNRLSAYDSRTGKKRWELPENIDMSRFKSGLYESFPYSVDERDLGSPAPAERWLPAKDELLRIDTKTGKVTHRLPFIGEQSVEQANERYFLLITGSREWPNETFTTALYDTVNSEIVWEREGRGAGAIVKEDALYLALDGHPAALQLATGRTIWQSPLTDGGPRMILRGDELLVQGWKHLYTLRAKDGTALNRVAGQRFGYPDLREKPAVEGYVTKLGNDVYVGSGNGMFTKLK